MAFVHYGSTFGSRRTIPDPCTPDLGLGGRSDPCMPLSTLPTSMPLSTLPTRTCGFELSDQPLVHHVGRRDMERVRYDVQHLHHDVHTVQHDVHHTHHDVQHLEHNVSHFHHDGGRVVQTVQEPCLRDLDYDLSLTHCHRPRSPIRTCTAVQMVDEDPWYYRRLQGLRSSVGRIGVLSEWPSRFGRTPCREVMLPGCSTRPEIRVRLFCEDPRDAARADVHFGAHGRGIEVTPTSVRSSSVPCCYR